MSEYFLEELSRKMAILGSKRPLNPLARKVMRCAECILARHIEAGAGNFFTAPEILRCLKLTEPEVRVALNRPLNAGVVRRSAGVRNDNVGGTVPKRYEPVVGPDGESFFRPAVDPDCQNKNDAVGKRYTSAQLAVMGCLKCVSKARADGHNVTFSRRDISNCSGTTWAGVDYVVSRELIPKGLLAPCGSGLRDNAVTYSLTESGVDYLGTVPIEQELLLEGCYVREILSSFQAAK